MTVPPAPLARRLGAAGLAALAALALLPGPAARAHAELLAGEPDDGATVTEPPEEIRLEFDEPVDPREVTIVGPDGAELTAGDPRGDGAVVTQRVHAPATAGAHAVTWRVVSADGHTQDGELTFTYTGPTADAPPADDDPSATGATWWPLAALGAAVVVVGLLAAMAWRRLGRQSAASGDR